jgi:hypothetical protein
VSRKWLTDDGADDVSVAAINRHLEAALTEVRAAPLLAALLAAFAEEPPVAAIVCLGVGRFAVSRAARYQLALALLLRDALQPPAAAAGQAPAERAELHLFDPLLGEHELRCARERGCTLRPHNEAGKVALPGRTLYLVLHCPRALYSNLLEANWGPERLPEVLVLGNSFAALADAPTAAEAARTAAWCRVTRAAPLVTERPCSAMLAAGSGAADFEHAFANTSLHSFRREAMPPADDALWTRPLGPAPAPSDVGLLADWPQ